MKHIVLSLFLVQASVFLSSLMWVLVTFYPYTDLSAVKALQITSFGAGMGCLISLPASFLLGLPALLALKSWGKLTISSIAGSTLFLVVLVSIFIFIDSSKIPHEIPFYFSITIHPIIISGIVVTVYLGKVGELDKVL